MFMFAMFSYVVVIHVKKFSFRPKTLLSFHLKKYLNKKMSNEESDVSNTVCNSNESVQISENENEDSKEVLSEQKCNKEEIIKRITELAHKRDLFIKKNLSLQQKLAIFISGTSEKDYFLKMNIMEDADEWTFKKLLNSISIKEDESQYFSNKSLIDMESLKEEIKQKSDNLVELKSLLKETTEKAALHSVNSESGECFISEDVKELLMREEEVSKTLQEYQLYSIQKRHNLSLATEKKRNLAEGPLNFAEYEMMCIETQNNREIIQPISEEMKNILKKTSNIINVLSHLGQKLYLAQKEKNKALSAEKKLEAELNDMRDMLFEEKMRYTQMKRASKELEHKFILLQHPRLIEDYHQVQKSNEAASKELQRLKTIYEEETKIINK